METSVSTDRVFGQSVVRVKQGTDELLIQCSSPESAENNAVILQTMFDKAKHPLFFEAPEDASKKVDGYKVVGYYVRISGTEPADGCGKAKVGDSGLWMSWQAKLEPIAELSPA